MGRAADRGMNQADRVGATARDSRNRRTDRVSAGRAYRSSEAPASGGLEDQRIWPGARENVSRWGSGGSLSVATCRRLSLWYTTTHCSGERKNLT
jgi:hypothetical protein